MGTGEDSLRRAAGSKMCTGRDEMMNSMQDYGVYVEIPIREAVGGKHIRGFSIAHMKGDRVRWRFVATEVNTQFREDNHQGTPPLMLKEN